KYPAAEILLIQLEIPMETVKFAASYAKDKGMKVILNPAPANDKIAGMFNLIDIITPNVHEAEMLSGIKITDLVSAEEAARNIHKQGVDNVIITIGKRGAVLLENNVFHHIPAQEVETVDTTAA